MKVGQDSPEEFPAQGVNLGASDRRFRGIFGGIGVVVTAVLSCVFVICEAPREMRLFVGIPAFLGALGLIQAAGRFCVMYGILGVCSLGDGACGIQRIDDETVRRRHRRKSMLLVLLALVIALIVTAMVYVFPE